MREANLKKTYVLPHTMTVSDKPIKNVRSFLEEAQEFSMVHYENERHLPGTHLPGGSQYELYEGRRGRLSKSRGSYGRRTP